VDALFEYYYSESESEYWSNPARPLIASFFGDTDAAVGDATAFVVGVGEAVIIVTGDGLGFVVVGLCCNVTDGLSIRGDSVTLDRRRLVSPP
jgi:hypothetical protein